MTRLKSPNVKLTVGTTNGRCSVDSDLLVYTLGTFLIVLFVYAATRSWPGYTAPEELDLGSVQVPFNRPFVNNSTMIGK